MLMLAFVFQLLAVKKPKLDSGVFAYAKAGFGEYLGFFSGFGYWASACAGNTFYWVFIMSTLTGLGVPGLGSGDTILAVAISSAGLWLFFALIRRGVQNATAINTVLTIAKIVPIIVFVLLCLFVFRSCSVRGELGRGGLRRESVESGARNDARHRLRLPRSGGGERLLASRAEAQ